MAEYYGIALLSTNQEVIEKIREIAASEIDLQLVGICDRFSSLQRVMQDEDLAIIAIDVTDDPDGLLKQLELFHDCHPSVPAVVLARRRREDWLLRAMQAGARFYVETTSSKEDIAATLRSLAYKSKGRFGSSNGAVVTVLSGSGGCGGTTVAINIARELWHLEEVPALLVDLDVAYGAAGPYLGVQGSYGIADLLADSATRRPDAELISSIVAHYSDSLHVLLSPATVDFANPRPMVYENLDIVLEACRQAYHFTVIDAPRARMDTAIRLARHSLGVIIVFELNVKDIRTTRSIIDALTEYNVDKSKILPVANRYRRGRTMVSLSDAQRALGQTEIEVLPNDYVSAVAGLNYGQTLEEVAPDSDLRNSIYSLALRLGRAHTRNTQLNEAR